MLRLTTEDVTQGIHAQHLKPRAVAPSTLAALAAHVLSPQHRDDLPAMYRTIP